MSWLFGKKNPSSPAPKQGGGDQTPPSADELVRDVKKEFERRLEALSDSLQLQSEENTQLAKQLEDERTQGKEYQKKIAKLELDLEEEREVGKELQRRLEAMARVLEDVVMQQQTPAQFQKPYEDERFPSQDDLSKAKVQRSASGGLSPREKPSDIVTASAKPTQPEETEDEKTSGKKEQADSGAKGGKQGASGKKANVPSLKKPLQMRPAESDSDEEDGAPDAGAEPELSEEELADPAQALKEAKIALEKANKQLFSLQQKNEALASSIGKYETKLVKADKTFRENLFKETRRRKDAEYVVTVLKKRISQLQFLLDERDDSSSDDEEEGSSEEKKKKKEEPAESNTAKTAKKAAKVTAKKKDDDSSSSDED